jgi:hypothetical protein
MIDINLLVIDHLHGLAPAVDLNYSHFVDEAFLPIQEFLNATGIPILLLHHGNKSGSGRAANSALIEAKARLLGRISSSRGKNKTIEFIGNQIETYKVSVLIRPEGIEVSESKKAEKKKKQCKAFKKIEKETKMKAVYDGHDITGATGFESFQKIVRTSWAR